MTLKSRLWIVLAVFLLALTVYAQDDETCPAVVAQVMANLGDICAETGRNQACYGNNLIDLTPQPNVRVASFTAPGDLVALSAVQKLELEPLNTEDGVWGVALLRLQANLPETLPGQNVTMLMFGDVEIENAADDESDLQPMQAFYFKTGIGEIACNEAPENGILIQTPEGAGEIELAANGAVITLGSTAFLQAYDVTDADIGSGELAVSVLEGQGSITAFGETQVIPAGSWVRMTVDRNFNPVAAPFRPEPYAKGRFERLPLRALDRQITPATPLTGDQIDAILAEITPDTAAPAETYTLTVNNSIRTDVALTFDGMQRITIASYASQSVELTHGMHQVTICAVERCVSRVFFMGKDKTRTVRLRTFDPDR